MNPGLTGGAAALNPIAMRTLRVFSAALITGALSCCSPPSEPARVALQATKTPAAEADLQSLIQALGVPEKRLAALESLRTYKGRREPALPALTKILEAPDSDE